MSIARAAHADSKGSMHSGELFRGLLTRALTAKASRSPAYGRRQKNEEGSEAKGEIAAFHRFRCERTSQLGTADCSFDTVS